jgi:hypothetical protein
MPNIIKPKKKIKKKTTALTKAKPTTKKSKNSPVDYYNCLLTQAQQN